MLIVDQTVVEMTEKGPQTLSAGRVELSSWVAWVDDESDAWKCECDIVIVSVTMTVLSATYTYLLYF